MPFASPVRPAQLRPDAPLPCSRERRRCRRRSAFACATSPDQLCETWQPCTEQLMNLGLSAEEADRALRRAHGWGVQAYWRKSKVDEPPQPELLRERLEWLRERVAGEGGAEEADAALRKLVAAFPEALGLDVQTVLAPSVALLAKSYGISAPSTLAGVLARKPAVLGNVVDCSGDCVGECNRCWARF